MTPEEHIAAALRHLAGGRVFPDVAEPDTTTPYITYQVTGGEPVTFISDDIPDKQNLHIQVRVWSRRREEASHIGAQAERALLAAASLQADVLTCRIASYDETTQYRGTTQDFQLFC